MTKIKEIENIKEFGGFLKRYTHYSNVNNCVMTFSIYLPPQAKGKKAPCLYWLSGLTCTDDNVRTKAGMQKYAAELGIAIVMPDTSPRGDDVVDYPDRYDLGKGAGFYVDATQSSFSENYNMYSYIVNELPALIEENFPVLKGVKSISGHSMGGHGALICALKNQGAYRSVSAFSPICNPTICSWGEGCFSTYLGQDKKEWQEYDATCLIENGSKVDHILVDQGTADEFLDQQLYPENLKNACNKQGLKLELRMRDGYDHSYHFISSFIGEHLHYHNRYLKD
jgi:S-formylglutathione hydrolase